MRRWEQGERSLSVCLSVLRFLLFVYQIMFHVGLM